MGEGTKKPAKPEDEVHRKFREALERKTSAAKGNESSRGQGGSSGVGPATNDKQKRQFRRKSGG